ncbi:N-acetylmuramoyl-L-alanine amidase [Microbulbifer thermotolerans]|uniref:N-acetylmuramoyl-L-alanine amidase n=1 Tax=Microbulbifer thermotolerans TaxID=252514 RepID=A0A143HK64_MICTH|nr:N-acetylmuramoyl-L-alanine amidase [Microbulbifer thermotolerans]AMX01877.1 N-acetylmuramoyl-L-alanine amidase [Microbulbifer thermotolerans]MCX2779230.1 N-acetylmuramoyl-L-alanine amidase [Microbulbifer thermotolerans]MCX2781668.1 N-acetylmuramoyl-L-alanine amidase [Microbulbifer thermotolerans]MCX2793540.1 N-acetylmuramoyl-L-alanine amidase [Microbulbifer thermotolerans]MCX2801590.1 N-acetylmuramoyl-L-alanine amidase [Microbulbifer thermotolerans]
MPTASTPGKRWKTLLAALCPLALTACAGSGFQNTTQGDFPVETVRSQNASERVRFLVMHYTSSDFGRSLELLTEPSPYPVSAHYLIPEHGDPSYANSDLRVYQLVDESRRAWHAGAGTWEDRIQVNDQSIGIEIVNRAHCHPPVETVPQKAGEEVCFFPEFDDEQIALVIALAKDILARYPEITPTRVIGHSDIRPYNKVDPGPRFPWAQLAAAGIGAWYDDDTVVRYLEKLRGDSDASPENIRRHFAQGLADYGYGIDPETATDEDISIYTRAFQYHFRPWKVDGKIDDQTRAILLALLEKYFPEKLNQNRGPSE